MQVILLQDIPNFGKKYDVKNVKDGYARNFLLPKNLVKIATEKTIKELEKQKAILEQQEKELKEKLESVTKNLDGKEFKFFLKTGGEEKAFGSISVNDIKTRIYADAGTDLRGSLENIKIDLKRPIKTLGEHKVEVDLGRGVKTEIKVVTEAED